MKKIILTLLALPQLIWADVSLDIQKGVFNPFQMAIIKFGGASSLAANVRDVVQNDLDHSGFISVISEKAYVETLTFDNQPSFADWRLLKSRGILQGKVEERGNILIVHFKFWDVYDEQKRLDFTMQAEKKDWRRLSHIMADRVYEAITGNKGYFDTRIVYVSEKGDQGHREKRLALMDQDGGNHTYLTDGRESVITPRFSPVAQKVVYVSYGNGKEKAKVYLLDLNSGEKGVLTSLEGITYAPRFSQNGQEIIFSQAKNGYSNIYLYHLNTRKVKALTRGASIDTSPCFSPDGKKIVFNSDRGGKKHLYVMNSDGSNINRISFGDGVYATPVWSPDGALIAFTKVEQGRFYIGTMNVDGAEEKVLADGFLVEGPSWSPDGSMLTFYRQERWGSCSL